MNFTDTDEDTGEPLWGCPRLSVYGAGWLIDLYDAGKGLRGVLVAKGDALAWIQANPAAVEVMQAEVKAWLKG